MSMKFVVKKSRVARRSTISGKGGADAKSTLAVAKSKLGELVKKGKAKEGDKYRCAVLDGDQKKDEWTISARAKNASLLKKENEKKAS